MDVRCEKCQTEYELDEARLKPGGVTVKCTNCGHMFKIRKRSPTNVGAAAPEVRPRAPTKTPPRAASPDEHDDPTKTIDGSAGERQWLIRLENGEQKSCRELATLQQWIVAHVVTRESLISRTGKTWKRLGDISELAQYFDIADEARHNRAQKPTGKSPLHGTMLGIGGAPKAVGGTIIPDDDEIIDKRSTGSFAPAKRPPTAPPPAAKVPTSTKTPPMGSGVAARDSAPPAALAATVPARPNTQPPPPPAKKETPTELPSLKAPPPDDRPSTAAWAKDPSKPAASDTSKPFGGKISAVHDEPAFAGKVRTMPSDEASFQTGKVRMVDDDDDLLPNRRGSRSGVVALLLVLALAGAVGAAVYFLVIRSSGEEPAPVAGAGDAQQVAAADDGGMPDAPLVAADAPAPASPAEVARGELPSDVETRVRTAVASLAAIDEPPAHAIRALLLASVVQSLNDRAILVEAKADADKLRKEASTLLIDAATAAQKAQKALPDDPSANLAMAKVLRLQGKPASALKQYTATAKAKAGADWARDVALHEAMLLRRDAKTPAKLDEAAAALAAIDSGDGALEKSGDVRARFQRAMIAVAQNKPADAKPLVEQVLAAQQEHVAARALASKLDTAVASSDPLPPEDNGGGSAATKPNNTSGTGGGTTSTAPAGDSYDRLIQRADQAAESSCAKASELYNKALEQKPTGIEALTGLGYCHTDAKQFASAHSRFRSALAISPRYEPALLGIAEAYQQQGRREDAITAYRAVLEVHPESAKAKRQLERLLGGSGGGSSPGGGTEPGGAGSASPPPAGAGPGTTPAPTPTPAPAPSGGGSGAGSGSA